MSTRRIPAVKELKASPQAWKHRKDDVCNKNTTSKLQGSRTLKATNCVCVCPGESGGCVGFGGQMRIYGVAGSKHRCKAFSRRSKK